LFSNDTVFNSLRVISRVSSVAWKKSGLPVSYETVTDSAFVRPVIVPRLGSQALHILSFLNSICNGKDVETVRSYP